MERTSVYQYFDARGVILYAGITAQGPGRQNQHNKTAEWWDFVASQAVEHYDTREVAQARETMLIRQHRPPFNRQQNPDHPKLRGAYLTLFAPRVQAEVAPLHECVACVGDDEPCEWPDREFLSLYGCGDPSCDVCHSRWHGFTMGIPEGYEEGRKAARQDALRERKPCGHCWACRKEPVPGEEWDLQGLCEVLNDYNPCKHCGRLGCLYRVGHVDGSQYGHDVGQEFGEGLGFSRASVLFHDDACRSSALEYVADRSAGRPQSEAPDPFGAHRSVVALDARIGEIGVEAALKELHDAANRHPWDAAEPSAASA